eukprot:2722823-Rhodomonas_salina.6
MDKGALLATRVCRRGALETKSGGHTLRKRSVHDVPECVFVEFDVGTGGGGFEPQVQRFRCHRESTVPGFSCHCEISGKQVVRQYRSYQRCGFLQLTLQCGVECEVLKRWRELLP